jgi:chromosome segregation ATPase
MTKEQAVSAVVVSLIAAIVGWLTNRASNKANTTNVTTSSRVEMEKEAYERARKLDTETIQRQDSELNELETKYTALKEKFDKEQELSQKLHDDVARMTHDNYQVHRENTRILEMNAQILAENERLRNTGERVLADNRQLHREVDRLRERLTRMQRGMDPNGSEPIRQREADVDTNPMMPEVTSG